MNRLPVVAIVGRPNVGKSSLLNALVGKRISIVQDMPGVTRDRVSIPLKLSTPAGDRYIELMDTGGYGFVDPDLLTEHIKLQIEMAMGQADLILFIVDAQAGLTSADEEIATFLRRLGAKTLMLANKADGPRVDPMLGDFARLGLGTPVGVSALNDRNLDAVYKAVRENIDLSQAPQTIPDPEMRVAIVGKRNAGKSTLVNSIAEVYDGHGDRVIVSEVPGTTRDSVDVRFEKDGKSLVVIDTAGVRKKRHMVTNDVEFYSFHRAQRSVRRSDVVMLLIDGTEKVSEPDKKLSAYIAEQAKPVILVINKWDLVLNNARQQAQERKTEFSADLLMEEFREYLDQEIRHLDHAPVAFITAKDGTKIQALMDLAQHMFNQAHERVATHRVNEVVRQIMSEQGPSTPRGERVKVYYATQAEVAPPTIVLFVNRASWVSETYQRFMVNRFRELLPYAEVPIKLVIRERRRAALDDEVIESGGGSPAGDGTTTARPQVAARVKGRATSSDIKPKRLENKPRPKSSSSGKGPRRGTRPT